MAIGGCSSSPRTYESVRGHHLAVQNGNKAMLWFSGIHSNDHNSLMFRDIDAEIERFRPSLILVQGGFENATFKSALEAELSGESGYTAYRAHLMGIPCSGLEPDDSETDAHLRLRYSDKVILAMYVLRQMYRKQREYNKSLQLSIWIPLVEEACSPSNRRIIG
jgi:hypothetical protein